MAVVLNSLGLDQSYGLLISSFRLWGVLGCHEHYHRLSLRSVVQSILQGVVHMSGGVLIPNSFKEKRIREH